MSQQFDGEYTVVDDRQQVAGPAVSQGQMVPINWNTRLQYDDRLDRDFKISLEQWADLCDSIFPGVHNPNSIIMAIRYCRSRNLDIFKRPISVVPMWRRMPGEKGRMVDTIWPAIAEVRITAMRTGECAGIDPIEWGDDLQMTFEHKETNQSGQTKIERLNLIFPRWARYTVRRVIKTKERTFAGPQVFWLETYAQQSRFSEIPNAMWEKRPRGQIDKCAEAAAWRRAFPEELPGGGYIGDEMEGKEITTEVAAVQERTENDTNTLLERQSLEAKGAKSVGWTKPADTARQAAGDTPSTGQSLPASTGLSAEPAPSGTEAPRPPPNAQGKAPGRAAPTGQAATREAAPSDNGPPRPPPRRASNPAPTFAAGSSSSASTPQADGSPKDGPKTPSEPAQSAAPSSSAQTAEPTAQPTTVVASAQPAPTDSGAPRPPKLSRSTSITATAPAAAAGNGSQSLGRSAVDARQGHISNRPNFAGPFDQVQHWVAMLYQMARDHDDLNELMLQHVDPFLDGVFPQDRDTLHGIFKKAEQHFAP